MGMAASQARFLGLTARKTNTEYEGQQINQQRTALSNQSANYYNQLLGMTVPVPPSVDDYTKAVYTFEDGAINNQITSMIAKGDGNYTISYLSKWTNDFSVVSTAPAIYTKNNGSYKVGAVTLRNLGQLTYTATYKWTDDEGYEQTGIRSGLYQQNGNYYIINPNTRLPQGESINDYLWPTGSRVGLQGEDLQHAQGPTTYRPTSDDKYLDSLTTEQCHQLEVEEALYLEMLNKKYGTENDEWMVRYSQNTTDGSWTPIFTKKSDLDSAIYDESDDKHTGTGASLSAIRTYSVGSEEETKEIKNINARLEQDSTGRIINITLHPGQEDQVTYAVTTSTVTDQDKYNDAMNQYEYNKHQYDQTIQEVNAKIEIVQAEDKNLELRLKQLDTEQNAIQTEMDAVQKVIEKNTESTFKTFG